ncbi:hypothetical protein BB559_000567 [Furculomyces boomerangus]|uniref:Ankyrin repeat protein n=2 Tax=Harpellales TaxID=61421 RepID=A0A2T9Z4S9_9FUNG|nr:hypothetical protein BB559_000567 [Furculomyces boomerangus]PWA00931.1 hypothetical protein BB558_002985 [Smittium angustum]
MDFSKLDFQTLATIFLYANNIQLADVHFSFYDLLNYSSIRAQFLVNNRKRCSLSNTSRLPFEIHNKLILDEPLAKELLVNHQYLETKIIQDLYRLLFSNNWSKTISELLSLHKLCKITSRPTEIPKTDKKYPLYTVVPLLNLGKYIEESDIIFEIKSPCVLQAILDSDKLYIDIATEYHISQDMILPNNTLNLFLSPSDENRNAAENPISSKIKLYPNFEHKAYPEQLLELCLLKSNFELISYIFEVEDISIDIKERLLDVSLYSGSVSTLEKYLEISQFRIEQVPDLLDRASNIGSIEMFNYMQRFIDMRMINYEELMKTASTKANIDLIKLVLENRSINQINMNEPIRELVYRNFGYDKDGNNSIRNALEFLIDCGAVVTENLDRLYIKSILHGSVKITKYFLDKGAKHDCYNNHAMNLAMRSQHYDLIDLICDYELRVF